MGVLMLVTGIIGSIPTDSTAIGIAVILIFVRLTFKVTLGPCCCESPQQGCCSLQTLSWRKLRRLESDRKR